MSVFRIATGLIFSLLGAYICYKIGFFGIRRKMPGGHLNCPILFQTSNQIFKYYTIPVFVLTLLATITLYPHLRLLGIMIVIELAAILIGRCEAIYIEESEQYEANIRVGMSDEKAVKIAYDIVRSRIKETQSYKGKKRDLPPFTGPDLMRVLV